MRQLTKPESIVFILGGIAMVAGAGCFVFALLPKAAAVVFLVGAVMFAAMQARQRYDGRSITLRRLRRIMLIGDALFVLSGLLLVEQAFHFILPRMATSIEGYNMYLRLFLNNWVVTLLIAAFLEMYTMHRISYELKKEEQEEQKKP